ncbi:MAG: hypothetical protein AB9834_06685 [Lentimicrobium sp.]
MKRKDTMKFLILLLTVFVFSCNADKYSAVNLRVNSRSDTCSHIAVYGGANSTLQVFLQKRIVPVLAKCNPGAEVNTFYVVLTISDIGQVNEVDFRNFIYSEVCKNELTAIFLQMEKWIPACRDNKAVTSMRLLKIE